jgi:ABC-type phosphate/phosphonate transport system substrate-binding protein
MIASLAMYDWPQVAAANDRLWVLIRDGLRAEGIAVPNALTRDDSLWRVWESPDLVLAQTCGMPYRTRLHGHVALLGTPDYGLPDAPPGHYYSELIVRADAEGELADFIPRVFAFNGHDSQSGWAAPQNELARRGLPPFTHTLHTRAHRESARAVADGRADIAAIDAVTWRLYRDHFPDEASRLRVLTHTRPTPGLPLITALSQPAARITHAATAAVAALTAADRTLLHLNGLVFIPPADYLAVPTPPPPSQDAPSVPAN